MDKTITVEAGNRLVISTPAGEIALTVYSTMTGVHMRPSDAESPYPVSNSVFPTEVRTLDADGEIVVISPN
jgi:hypothetical protein